MKIMPAILCGGSGTRLWPASRTNAPKQLQALISSKSMVIETAERLSNHPQCLPASIVCGQTYADEIMQQFADAGLALSGVIVEPMGRDTCAASACAALWAKELSEQLSEEVVVLLLPADHFIGNIPAFHRAVSEAADAAMQGWIATLSIIPETPETGFGYIQRSELKLPGLACFPVTNFVEKPPLETAKTYLASGDYSWNSGMFAFTPSVFLDELQVFQPDVASTTLNAFKNGQRETTASNCEVLRLETETFANIPKISIDVGVMENTKKACTLPASIQWSDVGSWSAIHEIAPKDMNKNASNVPAYLHETQNCLIRSETGRVISTIGLDGIGIIDLPDALLISRLDRSQDVKTVHTSLSEAGHTVAHHREPSLSSQVASAEAWATSWLMDKAIPMWASTGLDDQNGGSFESLTSDGEPIFGEQKRLRVQARQTFVFAHTAMQGSKHAAEAFHVPLEFMLKHGHDGSGNFARILHPDGTVADARTDTYDLAFVLYSLAYAYKLTSDPALKALADKVLHNLNTKFRHDAGGFVEGIPPHDGPRRANPHMHLLEASLAWVEIHQSEAFAELANEIVYLFYTKFFVDGLLREYFNEDLSPPSDIAPKEHHLIEPGHLCEWSWLLKEYQRLLGGNVRPFAIMDGFVETYGKTSDKLRLVDITSPDGIKPNSVTSRLWPQTEYIRWKLAMGGPTNTITGLKALDDFRKVYLSPGGEENGCWIDQVSSTGEVLNARAPASSLYHLTTMITQIKKLTQNTEKQLEPLNLVG